MSAGDVFSLGSARVEVLGPVSLTDSDNDNSLVLRIVHGDRSVLLTGDCGFSEEDDILKTVGANLGGSNIPETAEEDQLDAGTTDAILQADILKVAHHGSAHATSEEWLQAVKPSCAVISCGKNNEYGHPAPSLLKRLEQMDVQVYRTDLLGDICFRESKRGWEIESVDRTEARRADYIVNTRTGIFHRLDCESVEEMTEGNKWYFSGKCEELTGMHYVPCGACNPSGG